MSRIPTWEELAGSGPRAARGAVSGNTGAEAIGAGIKQIGSALGSIGADITEKENIDDVLKADDYHLNARTDLVRSFDNDSDYGTFQPRVRAGLDDATTTAAKMIRNPDMRKKWLSRATRENVSSIDQVTRMGDARAREDGQARLGDALDTYTTQYLSSDLDDAAKADILRNMDARIAASEKQGLVRPLVGRKLREQYLGGAVAADYENRLIKDPEGVIKELEGVRVAPPADFEIKPSPIMRNPNIGRPRDTAQIKGLAVHETQGSDNLEGNASWSNKKNTGANYYIDKSGQVYEWAPDNIAMNHAGVGRGVKGDLRPDLQNSNTLSVEIMTRPGEKPNEAQLAALHSLAKRKADQYGFSPNDIEAHGRLAPGHREPTEGVDAVDYVRQNWDSLPTFAQAAGEETRTATPVGKRGLTTYAQLDNGKGTQVADASGNTVAKSDLPPVGSGRADLLSPKQRLHILDKARAALSADLTDKVNKDIIRIKAGEEPEKDDQGLTAIDKAEKLMKSGAAYQNLRVKWEKAKAEREAIAPMERMSEDEALDHIAGLKKSPWLQKEATEAWKKQMKLRDEDPASMVIADNQVKAAAAVAQKRAASVGLQMDEGGNLIIEDMPGTVDPGNRQAAIGSVLESRLQAQTSRGMPDYAQRIITRREAKNLLQIDSPTGMDDRKYRAALESAAQRALDWYGPEYGKRALEEAISFQRGSRTNDKKRFEDKLLASIAAGEGVSQSDIRKYNEVSRTTDMMSREFQLQDPTAADDSRPYIGQPLQPSPQHIEWLKSNISDPGAIAAFDAKFGEGAAARALYAGQDAKTTADMGLKQPPKAQKSVLDLLFGR